MTQKLEPPKTDKDTKTVIDFSKLSKEEKIAAFKEAYKADEFKGTDLYNELGLEKPVEKKSINREVIEKLLPQYQEIGSKLAEAGYKLEKAAMSDSEKLIHEKIEKQSLIVHATLGGPVFVSKVDPSIMPVISRNEPHTGVRDVIIFVVADKHPLAIRHHKSSACIDWNVGKSHYDQDG